MPPYLLLYPAFDHSKTNARMADPKVVHPTAQNRIDFRNHGLDGPADVLPEDLPEPFKQRRPLPQLGRIVGPPLPLKAEYAPKLKTQKSKTLFLFQVHHPTLVLVDLNAELRELLAQPSVYRLHQPVTPPFGVDQDHHIIRKTCILDVGVLAPPRCVYRFLQHPVYLIQIEVAEQRRNHPALGTPFFPVARRIILSKCMTASSRTRLATF